MSSRTRFLWWSSFDWLGDREKHRIPVKNVWDQKMNKKGDFGKMLMCLRRQWSAVIEEEKQWSLRDEMIQSIQKVLPNWKEVWNGNGILLSTKRLHQFAMKSLDTFFTHLWKRICHRFKSSFREQSTDHTFLPPYLPQRQCFRYSSSIQRRRSQRIDDPLNTNWKQGWNRNRVLMVSPIFLKRQATLPAQTPDWVRKPTRNVTDSRPRPWCP